LGNSGKLEELEEENKSTNIKSNVTEEQFLAKDIYYIKG